LLDGEPPETVEEEFSFEWAEALPEGLLVDLVELENLEN